MMRAACLAAVAGLAASGSVALADGLVYDSTNATQFTGAPNAGNTFMGQALLIADPTPDPIALTGFDLYIANFTGAPVAATTPIRVNAFIWDEENPSTVATDPAYLNQLLAVQGTFAAGLGFAWNNLTYIALEDANPTVPFFTFAAPLTTLTDTEMCFVFNVQADQGAGFVDVPGLTSVIRGGAAEGPAAVGTLAGYYYRNASGLVDGSHLVSDARQIGANSAIAFRVYNQSSAPTPLGVAAAGSDPANPLASCDPNNTVTLLVQVTPATLPDSTGITVTGDTSAFPGGAANTAFLDDGLNDDGAAGDNLFGAIVQLPPGPEVNFAVPFTIADAELRTANGTINVNRDTYADLPANITGGANSNGTATLTGNRSGFDKDMFTICVSDAANFGASAVAGTTWDTQLFLFDSAGLGVLHNDDDPNDLTGATFQSNITGVPLTSGGLYYLAISGYNTDPFSAGNLAIWNNDDGAGNFNTVRAPDGGGAAAPIELWIGAGNAGGTYTIELTGATASCPIDLTSDGSNNVPDCAIDINDLLFFLANFEGGNVVVDLDSDGDPAAATPDCGVDINDLLFFLARFEAGC
jgi:hypothetical protein